MEKSGENFRKFPEFPEFREKFVPEFPQISPEFPEGVTDGYKTYKSNGTADKMNKKVML